MIPKIIWQTYKTDFDNLPANAYEKANIWKQLNPDYEYKYFNDDDIAKFVIDEYGQEIFDIFNSFKVPVMKADMWRYLVIYKYGGVYADIDTECNEPLSDWLDNDKNMIVAPEHGLHYVQYFFAASAGNPVIKNIIDIMIKRCRNVDYDMEEFIHYHTGPAMFTHGIRSYFKLKDLSHNCAYMKSGARSCRHNLLQKEAIKYNRHEQIVNEKFFCYSGEDKDIFKSGKVRHHFGSHYWKDTDYQSWVEDPIVKRTS